LVQAANDAGGRDNISVVLIRVVSDFSVPRGFMARVKSWFG
jgi:PPM family protein phosphatase